MSDAASSSAAVVRARLRQAFVRACAWDVAVRKPGNVSHASPGHRMQARMFLDSAEACADALTATDASVGQRIEAAVAATWSRVGCNTNLGIVLLCAPTAVAFERLAQAGTAFTAAALRRAWSEVMAGLTVDDAACAYRAIAQANPGGLGQAPTQDVHAAPTLDLHAAMALATERDRIAAQYASAGAELFDVGLAALDRAPPGTCARLFAPGPHPESAADGVVAVAVQRIYLAFMASAPDSHIVRKHGPALAHIVMNQARAWAELVEAGGEPERLPAFAVWDETLKNQAINPGTSADLTVATLMLAALRT
jgi:triphosphoribosyl-dephospho-CoA synthase